MKKLDFLIVFALIFSFILSSEQAAQSLSSKVTRLHILANSDSDTDQLLKISVRDRIIKSTEILNGGYDKKNIDKSFLDKIEAIAKDEIQAQGFNYPVKAMLTNMYFDTKTYDGFAFPAGKYDALRIEIGSAQGKNWWCVIFPPLCTGLASDEIKVTSEQAGLSDEDICLILKDGESYALRFKTAEIIGKIKNYFEN